MPKQFSHAALDAAFGYIADNADLLVLCEGAPDTFADAANPKADGGRRLGSVTMAIGVGNGDFDLADGHVSGRRLMVAGQDGVAIADTGTADHVALLDATQAQLLLTTTLRDPVQVVAGDVISLDGFDDEIQDPD
ncbi:MAG: hypothetical protein ACFB0F_09345 [Neomegalonema sp.]